MDLTAWLTHDSLTRSLAFCAFLLALAVVADWLWPSETADGG